jgi:hypothetical protein
MKSITKTVGGVKYSVTVLESHKSQSADRHLAKCKLEAMLAFAEGKTPREQFSLFCSMMKGHPETNDPHTAQRVLQEGVMKITKTGKTMLKWITSFEFTKED